jgi:hypothetical protein
LKLSNKEQHEEIEDQQEEAIGHAPLFLVPSEPRRASRLVQARREANKANEVEEATNGSEDDDSENNESIIPDSDYGINMVMMIYMMMSLLVINI